MGTDSEVPYFILPHKEETEIVKLITDKLEYELRECQQPLETTIFGKSVTIIPEIKHSQFDRSVIEKISGLGGALCTMVIITVVM